MTALHSVFNNRELAYGVWLIILILILIFTKAGRKFIAEISHIIVGKKILTFLLISSLFYFLTVFYLNYIGFWNVSLLKDTILWLIIMELPLFGKTIEKARTSEFFVELIKENISLIVIFEFLLNFWVFSFAVELIIVPVALVIGAISAFSERSKNGAKVKQLINQITFYFGIIVIIRTIFNIIFQINDLWNASTVREFSLPIVLLVMNLPILYSLALFNNYEQIFLRVHSKTSDSKKMKFRIFRYAGLSLSQISILRNTLSKTVLISSSDEELKINLVKLNDYIETRIGDNYMRRPKFYVAGCLSLIFLSLGVILFCNNSVSMHDLIKFNFTIDTNKVKEIMTYIFSSILGTSLIALIYFIGYKKKKYEEFGKVKKFVLYDLFFYVQKQNDHFLDFPKIEDPEDIYLKYVIFATNIEAESKKLVESYENLFSFIEIETIKSLQSCSNQLIFAMDSERTHLDSAPSFIEHCLKGKKDSKQKEDFNLYLYEVERAIKKYTERVSEFNEVFKSNLN